MRFHATVSLFATLAGVAYTLALHVMELPAFLDFKLANLHHETRIKLLFFLQFFGVASIIVLVALHWIPSSAEEGLRIVHMDIHGLGEGLAKIREGLADVREGLAEVREGLAAVNATLVSGFSAIRRDIAGLHDLVADVLTEVRRPR